MTSLCDVTIVTLMQRAGSIKGECTQAQGSHLGFWLLYIWSHLVRTVDPLQQLSRCLSRSEITTIQESVFVSSTTSAYSYLWHPESVLF